MFYLLDSMFYFIPVNVTSTRVQSKFVFGICEMERESNWERELFRLLFTVGLQASLIR